MTKQSQYCALAVADCWHIRAEIYNGPITAGQCSMYCTAVFNVLYCSVYCTALQCSLYCTAVFTVLCVVFTVLHCSVHCIAL